MSVKQIVKKLVGHVDQARNERRIVVANDGGSALAQQYIGQTVIAYRVTSAKPDQEAFQTAAFVILVKEFGCDCTVIGFCENNTVIAAVIFVFVGVALRLVHDETWTKGFVIHTVTEPQDDTSCVPFFHARNCNIRTAKV